LNKTTKIAALPLAALLAFGAAGCGNDDNDKDTANNSGTSVSASTSTKATLNSAKKAISAAYKAYPNSKALNLATTTNSKEGWVVTLLTAAKQVVDVQVDYDGTVLNKNVAAQEPTKDQQGIAKLLADMDTPGLDEIISDNTPKDGVIASATLENSDDILVWTLKYNNKNTNKEMTTVWADAASGAELASEDAS